MAVMIRNIQVTVIALTVALVVAALNMFIFQQLDASIGKGNVHALRLQEVSGEKAYDWYFGLVPKLDTVSTETARAEGRTLWARPGDYSGTPLMGVTFAFATLMWFIWIGFYLGFPANMKLVPQKLLVLLAAMGLSVGVNLILARMTADFTTSGTVLGNAFQYLSLGFHIGGIWFISLLARLGVGLTETRPVLPLTFRKNEKFIALLSGIILALLLEWILYKAGLTISYVAVDFAVWAIAVLLFLAFFGYRPSMWTKGERPTGLMVTIMGTFITVALWVAIQKITGGLLGAGIASEEMGNQGFSLMVSSWLVVWMNIAHHAGKCSPVKMR